MAVTTLDISMSLDSFIAGPNQTVEEPLGEGGLQLHEWIFGLASWRERHGQSGGVTNADSEVLQESVEATGAVVMGRRMFSGGEGPWENDPVAGGWWGEEPPFGVPVFVLTHHARQPVELQGETAFTFVSEGVEAALEQARAAAGDRNVAVAGGANVVQQFLAARLLDEIQIHLVPVLLGGGVRLFGPGDEQPALELTRVIDSPTVTHLRYRVAN
ncbi:MAG: dihydrofolate reductase [Actinobacteria bacterium]|nr:MAG: dihydrofolate reductase [Actinomycetota bacterium]